MLAKVVGVANGGAPLVMTNGNREIFRIGDNPFVGRRVRCTWLRPWGGKPAGFTIEGILRATFAVPRAGRNVLIGEVLTEGGKVVSCPWSRNFLNVEVVA